MGTVLPFHPQYYAPDTQDKKKAPFILKPHHERILEALYRYHFLTVEQVTRLFYSRGSLTTVRAVLYDLAMEKYVLHLFLPRPTPLGSVPKIYTLAQGL